VPADALTRIRARGHIGIRLGLERMRVLLARLGDPQRQLRGVLIGGTNGKGSVAAMVASMLAAAGYSTGQSPSPHLHSYRERVTIDGRPIEPGDLELLLEEVLAASELAQDELGPATEFELMTAAAYLWSARQAVDVMVMEVGLGGRLDASNTWQAGVAAITNVGLDHQEYLGDSLTAVAGEKAAIIKPGSRAVTGAQGVALEVIRSRARSVSATLTVCPPLPVRSMTLAGVALEHPRLGELPLALLGRHQAGNAAVALGIVDALGQAGIAHVSDQAARTGLAATSWPGRLELLEVAGRPVLVDGAHNPDGMSTLAATIDELASSWPRGRVTLLLGVMRDKPLPAMLEALASSPALRSACCVATDVPETERSLPAAELAAAWRDATGAEAEAIPGAAAALERALAQAVARDGLLVITGSLYLLGHLRAALVPAAEGVGRA
jgi:dihydrofolate synthase/folylpolyglutamate synthase